jgi:hypothetical protein
MLLCSAALVLSVGTRIVSDHPVACPPHWLPVLLGSSSHDAPATRRRMENAINPGCTAHYSVTEGVGSLPDAASMMPAYVTLNGSQIGYPADGTTQNTSCDQIAAVAVGTSSVRGTSSFIEQGFSVNLVGTAGEEIEFKYWHNASQREYYVQFRYTMEDDGQIGSLYSTRSSSSRSSSWRWPYTSWRWPYMSRTSRWFVSQKPDVACPAPPQRRCL